MHTLERYLLDVNGLILNPEYIFYDSSKMNTGSVITRVIKSERRMA